MNGQKIAEFLSIALTVPTLFLGILVVYLWHKSAIKAIKKDKEDRDETDYLILGITIGFVGAIIDNAYWGIAWLSSYLDLNNKSFWFESGVYANIPFRQIAKIIAGYLHIKGFILATQHSNKKMATINFLLILITLIAAILLLVIKYPVG